MYKTYSHVVLFLSCYSGVRSLVPKQGMSKVKLLNNTPPREFHNVLLLSIVPAYAH